MSEINTTIHPGVLLLEEFLKPLLISQNRLARDIDVPVSRIAAIVAGDRAITADTAMRLADYFGTKPELWMNLQSAYELSVLRHGDWPRIAARIRPYEPVVSAHDDESEDMPIGGLEVAPGPFSVQAAE